MEQFAHAGVEPIMGINPAIWSIWIDLSYVQRSFWVFLCVVSLYSVASGIVVVVSLSALRHGMDAPTFSAVLRLKRRCNAMRQLLTFTFYFFGFLFFLTTQQVTQVIGDGHSVGMVVVLGFFLLHCAFAANVFAMLLILHAIQWFVSSRVHAYELRVSR